MRKIVFIDIDGTVTDGTKREEIVTKQGYVVGDYGSPNRKYPRGKYQFLMNFNHKDKFQFDETLPHAKEFIQKLGQINTGTLEIFWLTARDVIYHEAIRLDLENRGLWFDGMRLICKPHAIFCNTLEYKVKNLSEIVSNSKPEYCLYVENEDRLRLGALELGLDIIAVGNCEEALKSLESHIQDTEVVN